MCWKYFYQVKIWNKKAMAVTTRPTIAIAFSAAATTSTHAAATTPTPCTTSRGRAWWTSSTGPFRWTWRLIRAPTRHVRTRAFASPWWTIGAHRAASSASAYRRKTRARTARSATTATRTRAWTAACVRAWRAATHASVRPTTPDLIVSSTTFAWRSRARTTVFAPSSLRPISSATVRGTFMGPLVKSWIRVTTLRARIEACVDTRPTTISVSVIMAIWARTASSVSRSSPVATVISACRDSPARIAMCRSTIVHRIRAWTASASRMDSTITASAQKV